MQLINFALISIFYTVFVSGGFTNPLIPDQNLPDPGVLYYNGAYYVANTGGGPDGSKFVIHKSTNLQNWEQAGYIFNKDDIPKWTNENSDFWAPELHIVNNKFKAIFTARHVSSGRLCVGIATAGNILGPYTDIGAPLINNDTVGSIDASIISLSNGTYYALWKDDGNGNNPQIPTWIKAQELVDDGTRVAGGVSYLIKNDLSWEGDVTEGPWVIHRGEYFYLFYSGFNYCDNTYAVGVARSQSPLGPYVKKGDPILKSNSKWAGPGHCSVVQDVKNPGSWVMIYHSWVAGKVCGSNIRVLMGDTVNWGSDNWPSMTNDSPTIADPWWYFHKEDIFLRV